MLLWRHRNNIDFYEKLVFRCCFCSTNKLKQIALMKKQFGQNLSQIGALYDFYSQKNLGRQSSGIELRSLTWRLLKRSQGATGLRSETLSHLSNQLSNQLFYRFELFLVRIVMILNCRSRHRHPKAGLCITESFVQLGQFVWSRSKEI